MVAFDEERLAIVKDRLGEALLSTFTRESIEGFQAKGTLDGVSNRTVNMDVGALRKVLKRYGHWRRLQDHVTMLSEAEGAPIGRGSRTRSRSGCSRPLRGVRVGALRPRGGPRGEHSMRGVEVKHVRRKDVDLERCGTSRAPLVRACSTSGTARTRRASVDPAEWRGPRRHHPDA